MEGKASMPKQKVAEVAILKDGRINILLPTEDVDLTLQELDRELLELCGNTGICFTAEEMNNKFVITSLLPLKETGEKSLRDSEVLKKILDILEADDIAFSGDAAHYQP